MTTPRVRRGPVKEIFWREYEKRVTELLAALDPNATVKHNQKIDGEISGVPRQIDALAEGSIAGQSMRVVVEAKCHGRKVNIEMIDGFVGKLLDLGAERGIFYSAAGFTDGAIRRANRQRNPNIGLEHLDASPPTETSYHLGGTPPPFAYEILDGSVCGVDEAMFFGPVVETYEEFLRGEGFLYIEG
ncbi:restriction endonuclease [Streptomyces sp. NPDC048611]|uniref:restriction endonuclease n=1 Tax=Streptomyces sp. NPDC048611 TaxID=3155635 RepID=UPI00342D872F